MSWQSGAVQGSEVMCYTYGPVLGPEISLGWDQIGASESTGQIWEFCTYGIFVAQAQRHYISVQTETGQFLVDLCIAIPHAEVRQMLTISSLDI